MKKGFRLSYRAVHVCGILHFDAELNKEKQIKQPGYPWEYPSYLQCSYTFRSPPGTRIRFWFNNFGTQKCCSTSSYTISRNPACCGYFQYYDVGSMIKNTINFPKSDDTSRHYSSSSEMSLYMHLARDTIYSGFSLTYTAVETCGTALNTSSHWKNITSPGFPNHHHSNQICTWTITAPYNHVINISTHFVNNETCCTRLQARESRTDLYQLSTGTHYLSRGTNLAIDFISEKSVMKKGFRLSYRAVHVCGVLHFDAELNKEKQIKQPGYPWEYPSYLQCSYTFRSPPGTRIRFWFNNFGTQKCCSTSSYTISRNPACCGYFQYYDVGSMIKNTINFPKSDDTSRHYSNSSEMSLYMHLARNTIYSGFSLTYTAVGDITSTTPLTTRPPSKPPGHCYVRGDPHYRSFDGKNFNFQGPCSYTLVKTLSQAGNSFLLEAENEYRGSNTRVSYLKNVFFTLDQNSRVELAKGRILKINDTVVNLPYVNNQSGINIRFSGRMIVLVTSFGLKISHDGSSYLRVEIPSYLSGQVEGLCGNFNGNPNDDFMNRTSGDLIASISQFANQYRSSEIDCNFPIKPHDDDEDICSENERAKFGGFCSVLNGSCFSQCHLHLDPVQYYEDCLFDACAFQDAIDSLENNVGAYARECQDMNVTICDWRKLTDTPLFCPPHSHYSPCMSRCPAMCVYHDTSSCDRSCVEGCDCDEGYLLSSDTCVKESECGCIHDGRYYKAKQSFYNDVDCTSKCTCRGGIVTCAMALCGSGERCGRDDKGRRACIPLGRGICSAWTDPHYKTFDGRLFDFMGSCSYYMARTHRFSTSDTRWFSIEATNEHRGSNTRVSYLSYVTVHLYNNTVRLDKDHFEINGATVQGYDSDQFMVTSSGRFLMLTTEHDVRVSFQRNRLTVDIPSTYIGEVQGFCGSYNNNRTDDFETVAGKLTNDVNNFSLSYQVGECPDPIPEPFLCSERDREKWGAADFCGVLVNRSGLFAQCHHLVDPNSYFQTCLTDLCATDGDQDIFTQALESYVAACHDNGLDLCDWRLKSGRENIVCPSRSRYVSCASPCSDTCANPFTSSNCPLKGFVEDCVCNVGYIRDGDYCIRKSECGNTVNGTYVSKVLKDLVPIKIRVNFTHTYHMMVSVSIKERFRLFESEVVDVTHGIFLELSRHAYLIKLVSINAFIPQSGFKVNIRVDFTWSYRVMLSSYVIERYRIRIHEINDVTLDIFSVIEQETSLFWLFEAGNEGPPEGADVIIRVDYMRVYIGFLPSQVVSEYRFNLFDVNDVTREIYARILENSLVTQLSQIEAFVRPPGITATVRVNFSHVFRLHIPPQVIDDYIIKIDVINDVTEEKFVELGVLAYIVQLVSVPAPPTNEDFLPHCTIRQAVTWVLSCEHIFSRPQPCLGPVTCRYKLDELLRCVGSQIYRCKIGQGPNKLDSLNLSWFNSDAILAALSDVTMQSDHPPNMELITFCFHADSNLSYPHTIGRQFNQCDETILDDLVEKSKTFYYDFTMAQSRKEICSSLMGLKVWFVDSVKSRCTFDDFAGLSESAVNYLSNFVKIVVETLEIFNFSTCRDEMEANDWFSCKSDRP
ncbi:uncharacterized protein LOC143468302 [Clavelina lepadiformis]|uniref:uncharacterized protein LOC143468302 n=1 Tax=Clavelina lepadiformis TaxID=159417 RepID=UPI0040429104